MVVTEGMTPDQYIAAINNNLHRIGTLLNARDRNNIELAKLNQNFDIWCKSYGQEKSPLSEGQEGQAFINAINGNFEKRVDTYNYDFLPIVDNGNFAPATASNAYLAKYKAFKLGCFWSWSIYTWDYSPYTKQINPYLFNIANIDIDTMVSQCKDAGIEYIVFTIFDNSNFAMFDNPIPFPDYILNKVWGHRKYDAAMVGGDSLMVDKWFTACAKYGIEGVPYCCPMFEMANIYKRTDNSLYYQTSGYTDNDILYFENYISAVLQHIVSTWGAKYFWLDVAGGHWTAGSMQKWYNAIKSIDPTCIVIGNTIGDLIFEWFPYDIGSNEVDWSLHSGVQTWDQVLSTVRTKNAVDYYIPQEVCMNIFAGSPGFPYYWKTGNTYKTQAEIQGQYDIAKAHGSPFQLNIAPTTAGVIPVAQLALFAGIIK